jgi:hypothetical protein
LKYGIPVNSSFVGLQSVFGLPVRGADGTLSLTMLKFQSVMLDGKPGTHMKRLRNERKPCIVVMQGFSFDGSAQAKISIN